MHVMREKWTDERLDDLRDHMDEGFAAHREALRDVRVEIAGLRTETKADIAGLRTELKDDIAGLHTELKDDIAGLHTELKDDIAGLRTELTGDIGGLHTELKDDIASVRAELGAMQRLMLRVGAGMIGTMALGFASILLAH